MCPIASVSRKRGMISWTTVQWVWDTRGSAIGVGESWRRASEEIERIQERRPGVEPAFGDLGGALGGEDEPGFGGPQRRECPGVELGQHVDRGAEPRRP